MKGVELRDANDRGVFLRFVEAVKASHLSKILTAERFSWRVDSAALARLEASDGKLILLINVRDPSASEVVNRYQRLADIERGLRILKQDIALAPLHHRPPERIRAPGMICFLALLPHRVMRPKLTNQSPCAALRKPKRVQLHCLTVGGQTVSGLIRHDDDTRHIFNQLDLPLPDPNRL